MLSINGGIQSFVLNMGKVTLRPFLSQFCVTNLDIQGFYPLDCMNLIYRSKDDLSMFLLLELRGIA